MNHEYQPEWAFARELDRQDPLKDYRKRFHLKIGKSFF